jgi:hypothetical protein
MRGSPSLLTCLAGKGEHDRLVACPIASLCVLQWSVLSWTVWAGQKLPSRTGTIHNSDANNVPAEILTASRVVPAEDPHHVENLDVNGRMTVNPTSQRRNRRRPSQMSSTRGKRTKERPQRTHPLRRQALPRFLLVLIYLETELEGPGGQQTVSVVGMPACTDMKPPAQHWQRPSPRPRGSPCPTYSARVVTNHGRMRNHRRICPISRPCRGERRPCGRKLETRSVSQLNRFPPIGRLRYVWFRVYVVLTVNGLDGCLYAGRT